MMNVPLFDAFPDSESAEASQRHVMTERFARQLYDMHLGLIPYGCHRYKLVQGQAYDTYLDSLADVMSQLRSGQFRGECSIATYLFQIFNNRCIKVLRYHKAQKRQVEQLSLEEEQPLSDGSDPHAQLELSDLLGYLRMQCEQISPVLWQILEDVQLYGYSMEEIAPRLGLGSARSVASTKWRALRSLRMSLSV